MKTATKLTHMFYDSSEERIVACGDDAWDDDDFIPVWEPQTQAVYALGDNDARRAAAREAMLAFIAEHPEVTYGHDNHVLRVDYRLVKLPPAEFVDAWLAWYYGGEGYWEPGHPLWAKTNDGEPLNGRRSPYGLETAIREGLYNKVDAQRLRRLVKIHGGG